MNYRTVDDMYERGTPVQLTDKWTPALERYLTRPAVVIDVEVIGFPRSISRPEKGDSITEKYDCVYTVALAPGAESPLSRESVDVIRVLSLDVDRPLAREERIAEFSDWCIRQFCGAEPEPVSIPNSDNGRVIAGVIVPHTIPMYEAQHRPNDHRNKSLEAIRIIHDQLRRWEPDVIILASTHWMPRDGFFIDDGALHEDGCDRSYRGVEPQLFSFPGDPELARLTTFLARGIGLPVRCIHRVAQEHAVWVPVHLICLEERIPVVPCSIWWRGPRDAHRRLGEIMGEAVRRLGRRALFVASGGLSHSFDFSQPPEYVVPAGERFDRSAVDWLTKGNHDALISIADDDFEAWNPEGRAGHLYLLRGALGADVPGRSLCYQGSNGTGYLTMVFEHTGSIE
jgi:aromatic ring-opening dioxygenase catalytic subunit (LigB family)